MIAIMGRLVTLKNSWEHLRNKYPLTTIRYDAYYRLSVASSWNASDNPRPANKDDQDYIR